MRRVSAALIVAASVVWTAVLSAAQAPGGACQPTRADMLGPFYVEGAPERNSTGKGLAVEGVVRSTRECKPLAGAKLEWWSANAGGEYDDAHRATQVTDGNGRFRYVTDVPGKYPGRPVHLHVKVSATGHKPLVTQIYPKPGENSVGFDVVLQPQ
jgi:protocatechuate 3,4-dioxygenase beta subunit